MALGGFRVLILTSLAVFVFGVSLKSDYDALAKSASQWTVVGETDSEGTARTLSCVDKVNPSATPTNIANCEMFCKICGGPPQCLNLGTTGGAKMCTCGCAKLGFNSTCQNLIARNFCPIPGTGVQPANLLSSCNGNCTALGFSQGVLCGFIEPTIQTCTCMC